MVMITVILIGCMLLMGFFMLVPARPHNNVVLENTLPKDKLNDPEVKAVTDAYKKMVLAISVSCSILAVLTSFIPYDSLYFTAFFILIFGNIAGSWFCEVHFIRRLRMVIVENKWEMTTEPILIDTKLVEDKNRKMVPLVWLIGSLVLTLGLTVYIFFSIGTSEMFYLFSGIGLCLWLLFAVSYYFIRRLPVKAWTTDKELNQKYNDLTKYYWSLSMTVMSYIMVPMIGLPTLTMMASTDLGFSLTMGYFALVFAGCFFSIGLLFRLRRKQDVLLSQATEQRYYGEDQYWRYAFYYNPNDTRMMVTDRLGLNLTINLGRPAAKITAGITGVLLAGLLLFTTIPMYKYDFSQNAFKLEVSSSAVTMEAPLVKTSEVKLADIKSIELIDALPSGSARMMGMGTENFATGDFKVKGKQATLYVNLKKMPILHIVTEDEDYYFTANKTEDTEKYYEEIRGKMGE